MISGGGGDWMYLDELLAVANELVARGRLTPAPKWIESWANAEADEALGTALDNLL